MNFFTLIWVLVNQTDKQLFYLLEHARRTPRTNIDNGTKESIKISHQAQVLETAFKRQNERISLRCRQ